MITSFLDKETELIYSQCFSKKLPTTIQKRALIKLMELDHSSSVGDLRSPPSNHLELLSSGKYKNYYSIRINDQWRIVFKSIDGKNYYNVSIVDYH